MNSETTIDTNRAFAALVERKDEQYREAVAPLDTERESLVQEADRIQQTLRELQALLPARARLAQFEADQLLVQGENAQAQEKLSELEELKAEAAKLEERRNEIAQQCASD